LLSLTRLGAPLLAGAALALGLLGPAGARPGVQGKYGGTLVFGLPINPDTLDPTLSRVGSAVVVRQTFCERLYDFKGIYDEVVPELAAALPVVSKDKLTYTIPLRQGVVFNDGTPFNAAAVVTSLERHRTHELSTRADELEPVDSVTASGPYTVVLHLRAPFTPIMDKLASDASSIMSPAQLEKLGDNFGSNPVCVGPFMFDHQVAGDHVTVIKSPWYYDQKDVYLDKIVFKPVPNPAAAAAALKAGDLDVLMNVATTELEDLEKSPGLRIISSKGFGFRDIRINIGNKDGAGNLPYTNVGTPLARSAKLRQAFEEAIDRNALSKVVYGGHDQIGCTPISPASRWFDPTIKCTPYDPAHARKLVRASGIANPTVHLLVVQGDSVLAQFIQAQEDAVGINVVIDQADNATILDRVRTGSYDAQLTVFSGRPDPDANIYGFLATSSPSNNVGYSNPRLDLILENARKAIKPEARRTLYHAALQIILNNRPIIYLDHPINFSAVSKQVTGLQPSEFPNGTAFAQLK
jgi:peptide/nickel transport system substrate-binding protein